MHNDVGDFHVGLTRQCGDSVDGGRRDERRYVRCLLNRYFTSIPKTQLRTPLGILVLLLARSIFLVDSGILEPCGFRGD